MRRAGWASLLALLAMAVTSCVTPQPLPGLVIRDVAVHDGTGAEPQVTSVVVADGRILSVGEARPAAKEIDGTGLHLVPALIDMHVHLAGVPGNDVPDDAYLRLGIAQVRDLGGHAAQLKPRMGRRPLTVYSSISTLNGEGTAPFHRVVRTHDEARAAVKDLHSNGAAIVKIHRAFPPALLPVLLDEAHRRSMKVTGHIPLKLHPLIACKLGMDGVEHVGSFIEAYVSSVAGATPNSAADYLLSAASEPLFRCLAERLVNVTPTLVLYASIARTRSAGKPLAPDLVEFMRKLQAITLKLYKAGVPLLAGSDSSALDRPKVVPGASLLEELDLLRAAGIEPRGVQRIAGANAARALGQSADGKLISRGMPADFLLLDQDPATDWSALGRPRFIFIGGVPLR